MRKRGESIGAGQQRKNEKLRKWGESIGARLQNIVLPGNYENSIAGILRRRKS